MANEILEIEKTLEKLTMPQKIGMLAGFVCPRQIILHMEEGQTDEWDSRL